MADSLEAALEPLRTYLRSISEPRQRYDEIREASRTITRDELQRLALDLRDDGKKWKEIGEIMGGVTYQRAHQFGKGK
jgi:CRISPR/Cas system-associated exonuclease Cas4 (RecB family)